MQTRKISFVPGLIMLMLLLFVLTNLGKNTNPANPQGVMANNPRSASTAVQQYHETVTINGSNFAPQYTNTLPTELIDGSQWLLVYWWENHEIVNKERIDWGFFTSVANNQIILLAKCHDPKWTNPTPGQTVYTYYVSEGLLKYAQDPEGIQRFTPISGVINPGAANTISTIPAVPTQRFAIPTATYMPPAAGTQQSILPGTFTTPTPVFVKTESGRNSLLDVLLCFVFWIALMGLVYLGFFTYHYKKAHPS